MTHHAFMVFIYWWYGLKGGNLFHLIFIQRPKLSKNVEFSAVADIYMGKIWNIYAYNASQSDL